MTVLSMTGFGQAAGDSGANPVSIEIRSVNHRFAESAIRLPREYAALEERCRNFMQPRLVRGRVDISISVVNQGGAAKVDVNWALLDRLLETEAAIGRSVSSARASAYDWLSYPGVAEISPQSQDIETAWATVLPVLTAAANAWQASRTREGLRLEDDLCGKLEALRQIVQSLKADAPQVMAEAEAKFRHRISQFGLPLEDARLWSEIALLLDRLSIDEELIRLASHVTEFLGTLEMAGAIGRRLDFITQELHREINTIGSKSTDVRVSRKVVDAKTVIEQLREQVQNIA